MKAFREDGLCLLMRLSAQERAKKRESPRKDDFVFPTNNNSDSGGLLESDVSCASFFISKYFTTSRIPSLAKRMMAITNTISNPFMFVSEYTYKIPDSRRVAINGLEEC